MGKMASYSIAGREIPMPPTTQGLNTGMNIELFEPVIVGDRLHRERKEASRGEAPADQDRLRGLHSHRVVHL